VEAVLQEHGALKIERGIGADERARLWEVRHGALESIKRNHPGKRVLLADTCVPVSRYAEMVDKAKEAVEREGATGFFWGHAGFVAAEHGKALEYMRKIKQALDPKGILNPGKMLPED
jgi:D-lactate dehydrogenase (cytochrome)